MKIAQRDTAVDNFYSNVVPNLAASQNERVMAVIKHGQDYSLCELMKLVSGIDKSSMSRVVYSLRAAALLEPAPQRKCTITGVRITPSRLVPKQKALFE